eukprot:194960-Chlamydomonas_euryale.AAC.1
MHPWGSRARLTQAGELGGKPVPEEGEGGSKATRADASAPLQPPVLRPPWQASRAAVPPALPTPTQQPVGCLVLPISP